MSNSRVVNFYENSGDYFMCNICKAVLSLHFVSTRCHYFSAICLSDVYKVNVQNSVKCPTCMSPVQYEFVLKVTMGQYSDLIVKIIIFVIHNFCDKINTSLFINIARNFH